VSGIKETCGNQLSAQQYTNKEAYCKVCLDASYHTLGILCTGLEKEHAQLHTLVDRLKVVIR